MKTMEEKAGIVAVVEKGNRGPKDLKEFLECIKIEVEAIDEAKLSIVEAQENPDSTMEQRGATFMNESLCRESLYMICKQYIDWYL